MSTSTLARPTEVLPDVGLTYRQFDYWCRNGSITIAVDAEGSGSRRRLSVLDVARLQVLGALDQFAWAGWSGGGLPAPLIRAVWRFLDRPLDDWPVYVAVSVDECSNDFVVADVLDSTAAVCLMVRVKP